MDRIKLRHLPLGELVEEVCKITLEYAPKLSAIKDDEYRQRMMYAYHSKMSPYLSELTRREEEYRSRRRR